MPSVAQSLLNHPSRPSTALVPVGLLGEDDVDDISDAIHLRCAGGGAEFFEPGEQGVATVDQEFRSATELGPNLTIDLDETRVFSMRDLISSDIHVHRDTQVRSRNIIQFVILARPRASPTDGSRAKWTVPDPDVYRDLINRSECYMATNRLPCLKAVKWTNLWGKVGLVGLSAREAEHLEDYRTVIEALHDDNYQFTIFPREGVDKKGSISIVLTEQFRSFEPLCLPECLFLRNKCLKGALRVTHIKTYRDGDKTRAGRSKKGWRLVLLQGCQDFMRCLEDYDEDEQFQLGSGHVYIKGGVRRPRTNTGRQRGRDNDRRGRGAREQDADPQRNSRPDSGRRGSHNRSSNFPRLSYSHAANSGSNRGWGDRTRDGDAPSVHDEPASGSGRTAGT